MQPHHLYTEEMYREIRKRTYENFLEEGREHFDGEAELEEAARYAASHQGHVSREPHALETLDVSQLENIPVIAADEVGAYWEEMVPKGVPVQELLGSVAPPFDSFFVEIQGVENPHGFNAWGLLISQVLRESSGADSDIGWHIFIELIVEPDKNKPVGPAVRYIFGLDREGRLWENPDEPGKLVGGSFLPRMSEEIENEIQGEFGDLLIHYVHSGLMAVSFMHCRNVSSRTVGAEEKRSRSWEKKRGQPLTSYEVLEIDPMREVLESEGQATEKGLGHALHICRGHFKTFTEEAPLFGRVTGTFWWADQVRGKAEHGRIEKDYSVRAVDEERAELGQEYRAADEIPNLADREHSGSDPDAAGRGLGAHNQAQNQLAAAVEAAGLRPRSPTSDEPRYDLAWAKQGHLFVAEVKSITERNEERQLRLALGQVVRYRHQLGGAEHVQAVIALEREPFDGTWLDLCNEQGVILCWPETFAMVAAVSPEAL